MRSGCLAYCVRQKRRHGVPDLRRNFLLCSAKLKIVWKCLKASALAKRDVSRFVRMTEFSTCKTIEARRDGGCWLLGVKSAVNKPMSNFVCPTLVALHS